MEFDLLGWKSVHSARIDVETPDPLKTESQAVGGAVTTTYSIPWSNSYCWDFVAHSIITGLVDACCRLGSRLLTCYMDSGLYLPGAHFSPQIDTLWSTFHFCRCPLSWIEWAIHLQTSLMAGWTCCGPRGEIYSWERLGNALGNWRCSYQFIKYSSCLFFSDCHRHGTHLVCDSILSFAFRCQINEYSCTTYIYLPRYYF